MSVKVYSKPACVQCTQTVATLKQKGIAFEYIDLTVTEGAMEMIASLGYRQAPVVIANDQHWSGFRPDLIGKMMAA